MTIQPATIAEPNIEGMNLERVLAPFGMRPIMSAERLTGGVDNTNLRVMTDKGEIVIRRYELVGAEGALAELELAAFLAERNYPTPPPVRTLDGRLAIDYGGRPVALFPFIAGSEATATPESLAEQLGRLLAQLHLHGEGWRGALPVINRLDYLRKLTTTESRLAGWDEWRALVEAFLSRHGELLAALLPHLPAGPIHHDLHYDNTIIRGEEVIAVLDFGEINRAAFVIDLVRTCHYFAAEAESNRLPAALGGQLLKGYQEVRKLDERERQSLPSLFDLVNLYDAALFLSDPPEEVQHVKECRSLQIYQANPDYEFRALLS